MDAFDLNLVTNHALAVNQDALGTQGVRIKLPRQQQRVWAKALADGSVRSASSTSRKRIRC